MLNPLSILLITVLSSAMAMAVLGSLWRAAIPGVGYWISANAAAIVALPVPIRADIRVRIPPDRKRQCTSHA